MAPYQTVASRPHRREILVARLVELVELHPRVGGVELEIERRRLDRFLLLARQPREAVGEGVGDAEIHFCVFLTGTSDWSFAVKSLFTRCDCCQLALKRPGQSSTVFPKSIPLDFAGRLTVLKHIPHISFPLRDAGPWGVQFQIFSIKAKMVLYEGVNLFKRRPASSRKMIHDAVPDLGLAGHFRTSM